MLSCVGNQLCPDPCRRACLASGVSDAFRVDDQLCSDPGVRVSSG